VNVNVNILNPKHELLSTPNPDSIYLYFSRVFLMRGREGLAEDLSAVLTHPVEFSFIIVGREKS